MKISYKGDYALKSVLKLADNYQKGVVTINELADHIKAPKKFLEQILLELKRGGFVESKRGNIGGYYLTRPPSHIRFGDIIRFIEGPIDPIPCVNDGYLDCDDMPTCVFRGIFQKVTRATLDIINGVTFEDLVNQLRSRKEAISYTI